MKRHLVDRIMTPLGPGRGAPVKGGRRVTVNLAESPLTWLHSRGHLSDPQLAAGEALRRDYEAAQMVPGLTMRWDPVRVQGGPAGGLLNATERQIAARARFDGAVAAAGPGLSDVLWRVVCAGETLPDAEKALAWPVRSGKLVLKLALDRVAGFYRIV
ncbi:DUF6456 domain-containing protein [Novosphingobium sp.]|uniref:DUF6456 domain-containing protein n=1 Tax=Novosphingobium sp. TaxID=1874826 RepID=UPI0025F75ACF|nr:DUF6456 domain-containing protein [Novosphingobium sp.]